jgi:H+/Cl- antiporter ClcA
MLLKLLLKLLLNLYPPPPPPPDSDIAKLDQGILALMGAVAMLGGIQRSAISLCVIIMEGTQQVQFLLPIICTTVFARYVGNWFNEGLYEVALHVKHLPFLESISEKKLIRFQVKDIMSAPVRVLKVGAQSEMMRLVCVRARVQSVNGAAYS